VVAATALARPKGMRGRAAKGRRRDARQGRGGRRIGIPFLATWAHEVRRLGVMIFEHDGERISIWVKGRAHTQSVLALVRMERSGRTLTGLGCSAASAAVRALAQVSDAFCDEGRPPLSGDEQGRVLAKVTLEASVEVSATSPLSLPIRRSTERAEDGSRGRQVSVQPPPRPEPKKLWGRRRLFASVREG
jgi:hypothetical protein